MALTKEKTKWATSGQSNHSTFYMDDTFNVCLRKKERKRTIPTQASLPEGRAAQGVRAGAVPGKRSRRSLEIMILTRSPYDGLAQEETIWH